MKTLNEALEAHLKLQKEMSALYDEYNKLIKQHISSVEEMTEDKKELTRLKLCIKSSPSLN